MGTTKPRITVTLTDEQHATLRALSDMQGRSMSSLVGELVETTMPALDRVLELLRAAESALPEVHASLARALEEGEARIEGHAAEVLGEFERLAALLPQEDPRPSNHGGQVR